MIIGLSGSAGVGKTTVANLLVRNHCFEAIALADPMKTFCRMVFGWGDEELHGKLKETPIAALGGLTPRRALQELGTGWGRACYPDVWVEYAMRQARARLAFYKSDGVVVTDVRFANERDAIRKAGGQVWRIVRIDRNNALTGAAAQHVSETELTDDMPYDRVLNTTGLSLTETEALVARIITGRS